MRNISDAELIEAEYNLLEKVKVVYKENIEDIGGNFLSEYEDDINIFKLKPTMNSNRVSDLMDVYNLGWRMLDNDTYIIADDSGNYIQDSDFISGMYKWAARFGNVK